QPPPSVSMSHQTSSGGKKSGPSTSIWYMPFGRVGSPRWICLQLCGVVHTEFWQLPVMQSAPTRQDSPARQLGHTPPPQSVSVSAPLTIASSQLGGAQRVVQASVLSRLPSS